MWHNDNPYTKDSDVNDLLTHSVDFVDLSRILLQLGDRLSEGEETELDNVVTL